MVPWTFALETADQLADFLEYHRHFLPMDQAHLAKARYEGADVQAAGRERLQARALEVGRLSWGTRQALAEFVREAGKDHEREALLQAVRPTTAILLTRLIKRYPDASVEVLLTVPEANFALHAEERRELEYLRPEVWLELWTRYGSTLKQAQYTFEREAAFFASRLDEERAKATTLKQQQALQDLECNVFLRGDRVDVGMWES